MTNPSETTSRVNIWPERRRRARERGRGREDDVVQRGEGGIDEVGGEDVASKYFERGEEGEKLRLGEKEGKGEVRMEEEGEEQGGGKGKGTTKSSRPQQTLLSFSSTGQLSTRKPLTNPTKRSDAARKPLKDIALETKSLLPGLLATRPDVPDKGYLYKDGDAPRLDGRYCPNLPTTRVRVINSDSIDAALSLSSSATNNRHPCVLNMANARSAGGGWEHGALAQEEALCYRSSLSKTLKKHYYPLPDKGGIYSPFILVIRENLKSGHDLLDLTNPAQLPVISAVSMAAICIPQITTDAKGAQKYAFGQDRRLMEEKMRVILRIAAKNGHRQIVLGAFGCGAFANPRQEVAKMWASVLREAEFVGGWWSDVLFAVLDDGRGNLQTFVNELDGLMV